MSGVPPSATHGERDHPYPSRLRSTLTVPPRLVHGTDRSNSSEAELQRKSRLKSVKRWLPPPNSLCLASGDPGFWEPFMPHPLTFIPLQFVRLSQEARMTESSGQMAALRRGLLSVIPPNVMSLITWRVGSLVSSCAPAGEVVSRPWSLTPRTTLPLKLHSGTREAYLW